MDNLLQSIKYEKTKIIQKEQENRLNEEGERKDIRNDPSQ